MPKEYEIDTDPTLIAESKPVAGSIIALVVSLQDQIPPEARCDIVTVEPLHTPDGPEIAVPMIGVTVTCK